MRKTALTVAFACTLALAACGGDDASTDNDTAPTGDQTAAQCAAGKTLKDGSIASVVFRRPSVTAAARRCFATMRRLLRRRPREGGDP